MATIPENNRELHWNTWRIVAWSIAGLILLLPLVAMQFTDEVKWDVSDFAFAALLIFGTGILFELAVKRVDNLAYRAAVGVALGAAFLLVWVNAAVGIIGSENNNVNMMYGGVLAVGVIGTAIARFKPKGMARAMFAMALAQASVAVVALITDLGAAASGPVEIVLVNGFFVALFVGSALLFLHAEKSQE